MLNQKKITITVPKDPRAGVKVAVEGCPGPSCESLTAAIEAALGTQSNNDQTQEFFQAPENNDTALENRAG